MRLLVRQRHVGQRACPPNLAMSLEEPKGEGMLEMVPYSAPPLSVVLDPGF
jgi:hypothetical protein